jgi:hypothetical protein
MSQEQDFKKLQQRTYASYHQDGLIDIILGLSIIGFGLMMALDSSVFSIMSWMAIIFYVPFKNRITVPRIGYVKFSSSGVRIFFGIFIALLSFFLLAGIYIFVSSGNIPQELSAWIREYYLLVLAIIVAIAFSSAAFLTGITRLYAYGLLFLMIFASGNWLGIEPFIYVLFTGLLIEAAGIWLMVSFLRKYPNPVQEDVHE